MSTDYEQMSDEELLSLALAFDAGGLRTQMARAEIERRLAEGERLETEARVLRLALEALAHSIQGLKTSPARLVEDYVAVARKVVEEGKG